VCFGRLGPQSSNEKRPRRWREFSVSVVPRSLSTWRSSACKRVRRSIRVQTRVTPTLGVRNGNRQDPDIRGAGTKCWSAGPKGSGRTSLAKRVAAEFEKVLGFKVLYVPPTHLLAAVPSAGILGLRRCENALDLSLEPVSDLISDGDGACMLVVHDVDSLSRGSINALDFLRSNSRVRWS